MSIAAHLALADFTAFACTCRAAATAVSAPLLWRERIVADYGSEGLLFLQRDPDEADRSRFKRVYAELHEYWRRVLISTNEPQWLLTFNKRTLHRSVPESNGCTMAG